MKTDISLFYFQCNKIFKARTTLFLICYELLRSLLYTLWLEFRALLSWHCKWHDFQKTALGHKNIILYILHFIAVCFSFRACKSENASGRRRTGDDDARDFLAWGWRNVQDGTAGRSAPIDLTVHGAAQRTRRYLFRNIN